MRLRCWRICERPGWYALGQQCTVIERGAAANSPAGAGRFRALPVAVTSYLADPIRDRGLSALARSLIYEERMLYVASHTPVIRLDQHG